LPGSSHQGACTAAAAAQPASVLAAAGRGVLGACDGSKHFMAVAAVLLRAVLRCRLYIEHAATSVVAMFLTVVRGYVCVQ
jgi:hypothetical protein